MSERSSPLVAVESVAVGSPLRERFVYPIAIQPHSSPLDGHVQRKWSRGADERHAVMALEHRQLVAIICTTDGVSIEQAELQVTAFEKLFTDDPL